MRSRGAKNCIGQAERKDRQDQPVSIEEREREQGSRYESRRKVIQLNRNSRSKDPPPTSVPTSRSAFASSIPGIPRIFARRGLLIWNINSVNVVADVKKSEHCYSRKAADKSCKEGTRGARACVRFRQRLVICR